MKRFLKKIILFSIPGMLLLLPPILVLNTSGENYGDIDHLVIQKEKYLIGYAYNELNYRYLKWKVVDNLPAQDVLALGSSRILQFREGMFTSSFYNAGYTIKSMADFVPFLKSFPKEKYPAVLLISLDQWMFNEKWDDSKEVYTNYPKWKDSYTKMASISTIINVWTDLLNGKYNLKKLIGSTENKNLKKIGLNAIVNGKGFRNDGSIFYGSQIKKLINNDSTANDYHYKETLHKIKKGENRFEAGENLKNNSLTELDSLLDFCKQHNIYVVAIMPPFADKVNDKFKIEGKHHYMEKIFPAAEPIFKKFGFELWDMSNLAKFGSGDNETLDGFHGSEVAYLKMLIYMTEHQSAISKYTNLEKLKKSLENKRSNYIAYDY